MKIADIKKEMLADENFKEAYYRKDLKFNIGQMVLEARMISGVTQGELARDMGTKQPSIARVENGVTLPSLKFLEKMAKGLGTFLVPPVFGSMRNFHDEIYFNENKVSAAVSASSAVIVSDRQTNFPITFSQPAYAEVRV